MWEDKDARETFYLSAPEEMIHSTQPLLKPGETGHLLSGLQITSLISNTAVQSG